MRCVLADKPKKGIPFNPNGRGPNGYQDQYRDGYPNGSNADQSHHFAFFFVLGSYSAYEDAADAMITATSLAFAVESLNGAPGNRGDINLGIAAFALGRNVGNGSLAGANIGAAIQKELCK